MDSMGTTNEATLEPPAIVACGKNEKEESRRKTNWSGLKRRE